MSKPLSYRHRTITDEDLVFIRNLIYRHRTITDEDLVFIRNLISWPVTVKILGRKLK